MALEALQGCRRVYPFEMQGLHGLRVRNVVVQVHASPSRELTSDRDPTQIALERRVAEDVAVALQQS